eukprot:gene33664-biopygen26658
MPNTEASAMGHLNRKRQGLDSTKAPATPTPSPVTQITTYDDDIQDLFDSPDTDPIVYTKLFNTADFDLTARFPVPSAGARHTYQLVSCFKGVDTQSWQPNPAISAYHGLTGAPFDFRAHPIAPTGTAILIHEAPEVRGTWAGHGVPASTLAPPCRTTAPITYLQDLASLHVAPPPPSAPSEIALDPVREQRVPRMPEPVQEKRVVVPPLDNVPEQRVVFPTLAAANPVLTVPLAPTPIVALLPGPYPPTPGLPPLPPTDNPNHLMGKPSTSPTIPVAPTRRSSRPHTTHLTRVPSSFGYSVHTVPEEPYLAFVHDNMDNDFSAPTLTSSEVSDLLSAADAAWLQNVDHLAQANAVAPLNVNLDGSPLTFKTAKHGAERPHWQDAKDAEIDRLIETTTMHCIHLAQQPLDRRGDTTYYNPKPKQKYDDDMNKVYRIRGTAGGDRINYDGPTKANTTALPTVKILLQSVVSDNANFMTLNNKEFNLMTPLPRPEYIRIPLKFLSQKILDKHNLHQYVHNSSVLFEVTKSMYGLPHAGKIAQDVLIARLAAHGYHQTSTICLFRHSTNGVAFTLVVDDFGVKFQDPAGAEDLIRCLQLYYTLTIKKDATKFLGLTVAVDHIAREVRLSAPGVIPKALKQFAPNSTSVARSPAIYQPPRFGSAAQIPDFPDTSPPVTPDEHHRLQQLGGIFLNYCLAIDSTGLPAVTAIESALSNATQLTQYAANRLLAYFRNYPDNILVLKACDMRLHTQSDASYCTRSHGRSVAGGIAYLGNSDPTEINNGPIMVHSSVIQNVMASIGEAE